ncbi:hypothetical protein V6N13_034011 [Hibiscus sabdariffa]
MEASGDVWTVSVENLSWRVTRGVLWELFNHHGKITKVFIPAVNKKPIYKFSTFAFEQFASSEDLDRAIRSTNKSKIDGRVIAFSKNRVGHAVIEVGINKCDNGPKSNEATALVLTPGNCIVSDGLDSPSRLAPSLHLEYHSVEIVPDSLDGLENHLEGQFQNSDRGESLQSSAVVNNGSLIL